MYILEGNIGAGKSTFLKLLTQYAAHISIALEPLENWQDTGYGQSLLAQFYQDPKRWAYAFETLTLLSRVKEHLNDQKKSPNFIIERSIYSGYHCFARNSFQAEYLSEIEWTMYTQYFNFLTLYKCRAPLGFIYLRTEPELAHKRLQKRNREEEKTVPLEYLQAIHQRHEDFLINKIEITPHIKNVPVLILDCNEEFETSPAMLRKHIAAIEEFIVTTQKTFKPAIIDVEMLRQTNSMV